jgi:hypothetical protein
VSGEFAKAYAAKLDREIEEEMRKYMQKRMKFTVTFEMDVPEDEVYEHIDPTEIAAAGIEGPIDTDQKKLAWELRRGLSGDISIGELIDVEGDSVEITGELVDDTTDPDYLQPHKYHPQQVKQ